VNSLPELRDCLRMASPSLLSARQLWLEHLAATKIFAGASVTDRISEYAIYQEGLEGLCIENTYPLILPPVPSRRTLMAVHYSLQSALNGAHPATLTE
jgi:hypothetical protein